MKITVGHLAVAVLATVIVTGLLVHQFTGSEHRAAGGTAYAPAQSVPEPSVLKPSSKPAAKRPSRNVVKRKITSRPKLKKAPVVHRRSQPKEVVSAPKVATLKVPAPQVTQPRPIPVTRPVVHSVTPVLQPDPAPPLPKAVVKPKPKPKPQYVWVPPPPN